MIVGNLTRFDVPTERKNDDDLSRSKQDVCQTVKTRSLAKRNKANKEKGRESIELGKKYSIMNAYIGRYLSKDG